MGNARVASETLNTVPSVARNMALPFAKIVTPYDEIELTYKQLDELRMLISVSEKNDAFPQASPPVDPTTYTDVRDFIQESFDTHRDAGLYLEDR